MIVTTDAIVLHSRRYGDTSRIVVLYTRDLGKVSVVARGARKPKSPFGSALEPLTHCRTTVYHRKNRDLHTISTAELITPRHALNASYDHLSAGLGLCELVLRTQTDEAPAVEIFDLLQGALARLDAAPAEHTFGVGLSARLRLADLMGFGLPVSSAPPGPAIKLSLDDGLPRNELANGLRMASAVYSVIHHALVDPEATNPAAELAENDRMELEAFLSLYFSHHLDKRIMSRVSETLR